MSIATVWTEIKTTLGIEVAKGEAYLNIESQEQLVVEAKAKIAAIDVAHAAHTAIIAFYQTELTRVGADAVKIKADLEAILAKL